MEFKTELNQQIVAFRTQFAKSKVDSWYHSVKFEVQGRKCKLHFFPSPNEETKIKIEVLIKKKIEYPFFFRKSYQKLDEEELFQEGVLEFTPYISQPPDDLWGKELENWQVRAQAKAEKQTAWANQLYEVSLTTDKKQFDDHKRLFLKSYPYTRRKWYEFFPRG